VIGYSRNKFSINNNQQATKKATFGLIELHHFQYFQLQLINTCQKILDGSIMTMLSIIEKIIWQKQAIIYVVFDQNFQIIIASENVNKFTDSANLI
jgi:hypothetical protein